MMDFDFISTGTFTCWSCGKLRDHMEKADNWDITGKCRYCQRKHRTDYLRMRNADNYYFDQLERDEKW
jgi:hypothetical protein